MTVSLCTGKWTSAIKEIVVSAHLDNLHIGDGGAVVIDFINNEVIDKHCIPTDIAKQVIQMFQAKNIYVEFYTMDQYYIEKSVECEITTKHSAILFRVPTLTRSLGDAVSGRDVVKVMPVARNEEERIMIIDIVEQFSGYISLQWGTHPSTDPLQFGIITSNEVSKSQAARVISQSTHIHLEEMLGVGDSMTDWGFIELCGYAGAMGNASEELKKKVLGRNKGYIGKTVNENGVLDIFQHFGLSSS
jgi:hydroxymethylpyrimidine pyrophosphatase-like HAD family hydrolase